MRLELQDRVDAYHEAFPKYPQLYLDKGWLMGVWVLGNMYKRANGYYGAFPGNFLKRVLSLFPDRTNTLHLFSGTLVAQQDEVTVDCQATDTVKPSIVADAKKLPLSNASFDFVLADPPYTSKDAENYGTPMISRRHVMAEVARIIEPEGYLAWLDTVRPMYRAVEWKQVGAIMVLVSTNTRARCLSIFERKP